MNVPRAIGLAQALAHPPVTARTEEGALIQIEVARIAHLILDALDAPEVEHIVLGGQPVSIDASVWDPPLVRQALDELLKRYPMFDLVSIDWQLFIGAWVLVELGQPSEGGEPPWAVWSFAIFKRTGALHTMEPPRGPVSDDPIWTP